MDIRGAEELAAPHQNASAPERLGPGLGPAGGSHSGSPTSTGVNLSASFENNNPLNSGNCMAATEDSPLSTSAISEDREFVEPLAMRLNQFRLKGVGCDVMFIVGDEEEQMLAHKLVLGCSSSVFNAMFYGLLGDCGPNAASVWKPLNEDVKIISKINTENPSPNPPANLAENKQQYNSNNDVKSDKDIGGENEDEMDEEEEEEELDEDGQNSMGISSTTDSIASSLASSVDNGAGHFSSSNMMTHRILEHQSFKHNAKHGAAKLSEQKKAPESAPKGSDQNDKTKLDVNKVGNMQVIRVPDCAPTAFGIMIDYMYSNFDVKSVTLSDDNVMHTLYAAKKYDIRSLVSECVHYLLNGLSPNNAVCLLAQARLFQEETLLQQCFQVIDKNTDIALQAQNVRDIDRDTLIEVLGRSQLDPSSELIIFDAAKAWAEAECERRSICPSVDNLRSCLGPAMKLIRFPLMNVNEFGNAVKPGNTLMILASSSLLTYEEIAEVFLHLTVQPRPFCRYARGFRSNSRSKHVVQRFSTIQTKRHNRRENKICFTTNRDILVSALGIYGMAPPLKAHIYTADEKPPSTWICPVEISLASVVDPSIYGSSVCLLSTNNVVLHGQLGDPTPCVVHFSEPVACQANTTYVASVKFISESGVQTFAGKDGQDSICVELPFGEAVTFRFQSYRNSYGDDNGKAEGQIPELYFMVQWPESPPEKSEIE